MRTEAVDTVELTAFEEEAGAVEATLRAASTADPAAPGLGVWSLGQLVAHLVGVAGRLDQLAREQALPTGPPELDRHTYYLAEPKWRSGNPEVPPAEWASRFGEAWASTVRRFESIGPRGLVASPCGRITATEYLATRVLELVVHHLDLRAALDEPPVTTPAAGRLTLHLLENMLEGPRPRNFGRTRFILAATGRITVEDPRFPVLS